MLSRRDLIFSGAFASSLRPADALQPSSQGGSDAAIEKALHEVRDALKDLRRAAPSAEVAEIRDKQRTHFRANQKFPDFIDIGIRVWERLADWHVDNHLPLKVDRAADGRMQMELMFTTLVLKSDMSETQIGVPYDR